MLFELKGEFWLQLGAYDVANRDEEIWSVIRKGILYGLIKGVEYSLCSICRLSSAKVS
jgi:hypothetical protein